MTSNSVASDRQFILHIGAPKCASTAIQSALDNSRTSLEKAGFYYWSSKRHDPLPAREIMGSKYTDPEGMRPFFSGYKRVESEKKTAYVGFSRKVHAGKWTRLVQDFHQLNYSAPLYSSEFLASASSESVARVVQDLGDRRLNVIYIVRAPHLALSSNWQQLIKEGMRQSFPEFLDLVLPDQDDSVLDHPYWQDQHYGQVTQRWMESGATNFSILVIDPRDHASTLRHFERAAGMPTETLRPGQTINESISLFEAEVLLALNRLTTSKSDRLVLSIERQKRGVERYIRDVRADKGEAIEIPFHYRARVGALALKFKEQLESSGATIYGNTSDLLPKSDWISADAIGSEESSRIRRGDAERAAGLVLGVALKVAEEEHKYKRVWGSPLPTVPHLVARFCRELARRFVRRFYSPRS
jgi:hypothetical protein